MNAKDTILRCRITTEMRELLERAADERGESASLIVREALRRHLKSKEPNNNDPVPPP